MVRLSPFFSTFFKNVSSRYPNCQVIQRKLPQRYSDKCLVLGNCSRISLIPLLLVVHTQLFINNEFVPGRGPLIDTINPVNEQVICKVHSASEEDVDAAVDAANAAFKNVWKKVAAAQRGRYLNKLADLMERDIDELATLEALDNGKSFVVARDVDITDSIACFRYFAGWADKIHGNTIETTYDKMCYTRMEPVGCVASVTPWNYSIMMPVSLTRRKGGRQTFVN